MKNKKQVMAITMRSKVKCFFFHHHVEQNFQTVDEIVHKLRYNLKSDEK